MYYQKQPTAVRHCSHQFNASFSKRDIFLRLLVSVEVFEREEHGWELQTRFTGPLLNWYRNQLLPEMNKQGVIHSPLKQAFTKLLSEIKMILRRSGKWRASGSNEQNKMYVTTGANIEEDVKNAISAMSQACAKERVESKLDPSVFEAWDDLMVPSMGVSTE